jgi:hypothetical protein
MHKRAALGKGLGALISSADTEDFKRCKRNQNKRNRAKS